MCSGPLAAPVDLRVQRPSAALSLATAVTREGGSGGGGLGHGLVATVAYTGGGGGAQRPKKKVVYLKSTSDFGPLTRAAPDAELSLGGGERVCNANANERSRGRSLLHGQHMGKTQHHRNRTEQWLAVGGGWRLVVRPVLNEKKLEFLPPPPCPGTGNV